MIWFIGSALMIAATVMGYVADASREMMTFHGLVTGLWVGSWVENSILRERRL